MAAPWRTPGGCARTRSRCASHREPHRGGRHACRTAATLATATIAVGLPQPAPILAQDASPDPGVILTLHHTNGGESSLLLLTGRGGDAEAPLAVGGIAACASVVGRETAQADQTGHAVINVYAGDSFLASATLACSLRSTPARPTAAAASSTRGAFPTSAA